MTDSAAIYILEREGAFVGWTADEFDALSLARHGAAVKRVRATVREDGRVEIERGAGRIHLLAPRPITLGFEDRRYSNALAKIPEEDRRVLGLPILARPASRR